MVSKPSQEIMPIQIIKKPITRFWLRQIAKERFGDLVKGVVDINKETVHKDLARGRWYQMSLMEQLGNIGSEIGRARIYKEQSNQERFWKAVDRALELFNLTLADRRWTGRLKEIGRAREVFCDAISGGSEYGSNLTDLERYFMYFAFTARNH